MATASHYGAIQEPYLLYHTETPGRRLGSSNINTQYSKFLCGERTAEVGIGVARPAPADLRAVGIEAAAGGKLKAARNKVEEVRKLINRIEAGLGAQTTIEARAKLALADKAIADGEVKLEAKAYGDAFVLSFDAAFASERTLTAIGSISSSTSSSVCASLANILS